jgi:hypothetical protein
MNKRFPRLLPLPVLATLMSFVATAAADTIQIKSVNATGGSGCPQGTVSATLSGDGLSLVLLFDRFVASMGPGISITESRRSCTINLTVSVPQGFSFAITQIDNRGSIDLPAGVTARQRSTYRLQGVPGEGTPQVTPFEGPARRNFIASNKIDIQELVFSACGKETNVNVETSISLQGSRAQMSTIAIDSLKQDFTQLYHFATKRCTQ